MGICGSSMGMPWERAQAQQPLLLPGKGPSHTALAPHQLQPQLLLENLPGRLLHHKGV